METEIAKAIEKVLPAETPVDLSEAKIISSTTSQLPNAHPPKPKSQGTSRARIVKEAADKREARAKQTLEAKARRAAEKREARGEDPHEVTPPADPVTQKDAIKANMVSRTLARRIARRANKAIEPEKIENRLNDEARVTIDKPFDPLAPLTMQEMAMQEIAKNQKLAADLVTWQDKLDLETIKSIDRIIFLRDNAYSETIQLKAAQDLLDRAGKDMKKPNPAKVVIYANQSTQELLADLARLNALEAETVPVHGEELLPAGSDI